jgi:hypothetical protein
LNLDITHRKNGGPKFESRTIAGRHHQAA